MGDTVFTLTPVTADRHPVYVRMVGPTCTRSICHRMRGEMQVFLKLVKSY